MKAFLAALVEEAAARGHGQVMEAVLARAEREQLVLDLSALALPGALGSSTLLPLADKPAVSGAIPPEVLLRARSAESVGAGVVHASPKSNADGNQDEDGDVNEARVREGEEERRREAQHSATSAGSADGARMVVLRVAGRAVVVRRPGGG